MVRGHAHDIVGLLFGRNRARGQAGGPAAAHSPLGEGLQAEFGGTREELIADDPVGIEDVVVLKVIIEMVFDDAAHLDVGNDEGLRADFGSLGFFDGFVIDLAVEIDDRAIGTDGAGTNVADVYAGVLPVIRDFDIGKLAAFLGEYLDADIVVFGGRAGGILAVDLAVGVDGGSAGGFGLTGHFEVGGVDGPSIVSHGGGGGRAEEQSW